MSSNSKDQRIIEELYSKILEEGSRNSHLYSGADVSKFNPKVHENPNVSISRGHEFKIADSDNNEDDSVKGKLKKLLSDRTLGLPEEIDDSHLESLLAQYGLSDDAGDEEDITGSEVAFASKDSDSEEDEEDLYPESFNTENYLIATKEAKKNPKASDTTASYLGK